MQTVAAGFVFVSQINLCFAGMVYWSDEPGLRCDQNPDDILVTYSDVTADHCRALDQNGAYMVGVGPGLVECTLFRTPMYLDCVQDPNYVQWMQGSGPCPSPYPPPPSPPPPPPVLQLWATYKSQNCYEGHGAEVQIDNLPCGSMDMEQCTAECEKLENCQGVTVVAGSSPNEPVDCYRRAGINLTSCEVDTGFDTWVRSLWTQYRSLDCSASGGISLDEGHSIGNLTREECWISCSDEPGCAAVTLNDYRAPVNSCFRHASVDLSECTDEREPTTWVKTLLPTELELESVWVA